MTITIAQDNGCGQRKWWPLAYDETPDDRARAMLVDALRQAIAGCDREIGHATARHSAAWSTAVYQTELTSYRRQCEDALAVCDSRYAAGMTRDELAGWLRRGGLTVAADALATGLYQLLLV